MTDIAILTREESIALADCEKRIEAGIKTFIEVGSALAAIRDSRLYREFHNTFEDYCQARWGIRRQRANELITAARMVDEISSTGSEPPKNEAQAVAISRVPEEDRAEVWRETVERTEGKPTAAAIREVSEEQRKRAAEQRDARDHLRRIVELAWSPNWPEGHVEHWATQLGPYDEELSDLTGRALKAISVLDQLVEGTGQ
jgi:hypothetical protein